MILAHSIRVDRGREGAGYRGVWMHLCISFWCNFGKGKRLGERLSFCILLLVLFMLYLQIFDVEVLNTKTTKVHKIYALKMYMVMK